MLTCPRNPDARAIPPQRCSVQPQGSQVACTSLEKNTATRPGTGPARCQGLGSRKPGQTQSATHVPPATTAIAATPRADAADTEGRGAAASEGPPAPAAGDCGSCARAEIAREIDARGLQCPGPILQLKEALDSVCDGQAVRIAAGDAGFANDVAAWCRSTGHALGEVVPDGVGCRATVVKRPASAPGAAAADGKNKTLVVFSGDFDRAVASFIIANGAAAMGSAVTMFFTFWGLNVLRRSEKVSVGKTLIERAFGWMMPRGADRLGLSRMNFLGAGLRMIKGIMRKKNVPSLPELIETARKAGVKLVACTMSMDLMGIHREELIDGVDEGGVAMYLDRAEAGTVNLFI